MNDFRVIAIPEELARQVRARGADPVYGHPAHAETATGYGPCRLCLQPFEEGSERRLLFTLDSFQDTPSIPQPGPVYIHADGCERYEADRFPRALGFLRLRLEAYGSDGRLRRADEAAGEEADLAIADLLAAPDVSFVQLRNAQAGCYVARAVRDAAGQRSTV
jgi:hypothetical protein